MRKLLKGPPIFIIVKEEKVGSTTLCTVNDRNLNYAKMQMQQSLIFRCRGCLIHLQNPNRPKLLKTKCYSTSFCNFRAIQFFI